MPSGEHENKYQIAAEEAWPNLAKVTDPVKRLEIAKNWIGKGYSDFVLQHLPELNLPASTEQDLLIEMAQKDPEVVSVNAQQLPVSESQKIQLARAVFNANPRVFVSHFEAWPLPPHEQRSIASELAQIHPDLFILVAPLLQSKGLVQKQDWQKWDRTCAAAFAAGSPPLAQVISRRQDYKKIFSTAKLPETTEAWDEAERQVYIKSADETDADLENIHSRITREVDAEIEEQKKRYTAKYINRDEEIRKRWLGEVLGSLTRTLGSPQEAVGVFWLAAARSKVSNHLYGDDSDYSDISYSLRTMEAGKPADHHKALIMEAMADRTDFFGDPNKIPDSDFWIPGIIGSDLKCMLGSQKGKAFLDRMADQALKISNTSDYVITDEILQTVFSDLELAKKYLPKVLAIAPEYFLEQDRIRKVEKLLSDQQRLQLLNAAARDQHPGVLPEVFKRLHFQDSKLVSEFLNQQRASGNREIFSVLQSNADLELFLKRDCFRHLCQAPKGTEQTQERIEMFLRFKAGHSPKVWQELVTLEDAEPELMTYTLRVPRVFEQLSEENLEAFSVMAEKFPTGLQALKENHNWFAFKFLRAEDVPAFTRYYYQSQRTTTDAVTSLLAQRQKQTPEQVSAWLNRVKKELGLEFGTLQNFETILAESQDLDTIINFLRVHGKEFEEFLEFHVVANQTKIAEAVITDVNPAERFKFLQKMADQYGYCGSETERVAKLSRVLVLEKDKQWLLQDDLHLPLENGEEKSFTEAGPEGIFSGLKARLDAVFAQASDKEAQVSASERNREFAETSNDKPAVLPPQTLVHFSSHDSSPYVLSQGNLCGECIGVSSASDSYPFFVDTKRVDPGIDNREFGSLMEMKNFAYGMNNLAYIYPFRERKESFGFNEEYPASSSHDYHYLFFGGLPKTELGALGDLDYVPGDENSEQQLDKLKQQIVANDIYVPILDKTGHKIFSYEEFEKLWKEIKEYDSLEAMIDDPKFLAVLDVPQHSGLHEHNLKKHLELVLEDVSFAAKAGGFDKGLTQTVQAAALLHDLGKQAAPDQPQEVVNVEAAKLELDKVKYLSFEQKRNILTLIRHDELLGEILKDTSLERDTPGQTRCVIGGDAKKKMKSLLSAFPDPNYRSALVALYQADVRGIGNGMYEQWEVKDKLQALGLLSAK